MSTSSISGRWVRKFIITNKYFNTWFYQKRDEKSQARFKFTGYSSENFTIFLNKSGQQINEETA